MIESSANPKVKDMRAVRRCKDDRALLEGPHLVEEAVNAGLDLQIVVATERFLETSEARRLVTRLTRYPLTIAPTVLEELTDSDSPRGIVAVVRLPRPGLETLPRATDGIYVYADGLQDPGNVGAVARCAEGAGAQALLLGPGSAHPNHPRALRASAGSLLRIPTVSTVGPTAVDQVFDRPITWWGLAGSGIQSIYEAAPPLPLVLAVGSEAHGLSADVLERLDASVGIPLEGSLESLNAAVALGIALFEIRRQVAKE